MAQQIGKTGNHGYKFMSVRQLLKQIVESSDRQALDEFLNRPLFNYEDKTGLPLPRYLNLMREAASRGRWPGINSDTIAEKMFDIMTDRFTNLPDQSPSSSRPIVKQKGPDCRYYLRACLNRIRDEFEIDPPKSNFDEEKRTTNILQRFVTHQTRFCRLEAIRMAETFRSRYCWSVNGGLIHVWLPRSLSGTERSAWLRKNIADPNPAKHNENRRIQDIINKNFVKNYWVPLDEATLISERENPEPGEGSKEFSPFILAHAVAGEKAENIHKQRISIRRLGPKKLKNLILRIFEDIDCGDFKDGKVASDFQISKSTMSRFAGSRWRQNGGSFLPDLWRNTAGVLLQNPIFREVAEEAGYLNTVEGVLETNIQNQNRT